MRLFPFFARLSIPILCVSDNYQSYGQGVEVLFAGLAPGSVGIYQIDWRVPTGLAEPNFGLSCQVGNLPPSILGSVPVVPSAGP